MAEKKKGPGRKHKELTEEMERRFLDAIRVGCPIKDACGGKQKARAGLPGSSLACSLPIAQSIPS